VGNNSDQERRAAADRLRKEAQVIGEAADNLDALTNVE
jgi:hypothetical protein